MFYALLFLISTLAAEPYTTVTQWYKQTKDTGPLSTQTPLTTPDAFKIVLTQFIALQREQLLTRCWVDDTKVNFDDPMLKNANYSQYMRPYVRKLTVGPASMVYLWGDLHGDVRALSQSLYKLYQDNIITDDFVIIPPNSYFLFLGDMVDRGQHVVDLITLLLTFANNNRDRVVLLRGNHEDLEINSNAPYIQGKPHFHQQLVNFVRAHGADKFPHMLFNIIAHFYNMLPVAAFVGCNNEYIQCCHGGLEMRYDPTRLLEDSCAQACQAITQLVLPHTLRRDNTFMHLVEHLNMATAPLDLHEISPKNIGFLWNDFNAQNSHLSVHMYDRGLMVGRPLMEKMFNFYKTPQVAVKAVIRAHQHNNSMPFLIKPINTGVFSLWNNQVFTTIGTSALLTDGVAFLELTTDVSFNKWRMKNYYLANDETCWRMREHDIVTWQNVLE